MTIKPKVGDTIIIKGIVKQISLSGDLLFVDTGPNDSELCTHITRVAEVIPAPVVLEAGQVWRKKVFDDHYKILFVDDIGVYYEKIGIPNIGSRSSLSRELFIEQFELDE